MTPGSGFRVVSAQSRIGNLTRSGLLISLDGSQNDFIRNPEPWEVMKLNVRTLLIFPLGWKRLVRVVAAKGLKQTVSKNDGAFRKAL